MDDENNQAKIDNEFNLSLQSKIEFNQNINFDFNRKSVQSNNLLELIDKNYEKSINNKINENKLKETEMVKKESNMQILNKLSFKMIEKNIELNRLNSISPSKAADNQFTKVEVREDEFQKRKTTNDINLLRREFKLKNSDSQLDLIKKEVKKEIILEDGNVKSASKMEIFFNKLLENFYVTIFLSVLTLYSLFSDDIKLITCDLFLDSYFSVVIIIIILIFLVEFIISCIFLEGYFLSFFFFLDLLSILSMFLDIHWIYNLMTNPDQNNYPTYAERLDSSINMRNKLSGGNGLGSKGNHLQDLTIIAKATRGAKVGSRAARLLRILRIIRLIRIAKLYKAQQKLIIKNELKLNLDKKDSNSVNNSKVESLSSVNNFEESKVGKRLSDLTTKRVIILVLIMMIATILFDSSFYSDTQTSMSFGITVFNRFSSMMDPALLNAFNFYVDEHKNSSYTPILFARVVNLTYGEDIFYKLRDSEKLEVSDPCTSLNYTSGGAMSCYALFDNRYTSRLDSILSIIKTLFIGLVLSLGSLSFSKDSNEMVIGPVEAMIDKVNKISENPLRAMQNSEEEEALKKFEEAKEKTGCEITKNDNKSNIPLETLIIEKSITKIGALLALSFGEIGSDLIHSSLKNPFKNIVNPSKDFVGVYAVFNIRNFTDSVEVLGEGIMNLVNDVAEIIHEISSLYSGIPYKNITDSFLVLWKIPDNYVNRQFKIDNVEEINQIIDMSIVAYIKIMIKIYKSSILDKYRKNNALNQKIRDYFVDLGFGLNVGWSLEGVITSPFKIDPTYISPQIILAIELQNLSKQYKVGCILSEYIVELLSPASRKYTRLIDRIKFEFLESPINIYTIDLDFSDLNIEDDEVKEIKESNENKFYALRNKKKIRYNQAVENRKLNVFDEVENDLEFQISRAKFTNEFYKAYNKGFEMYINGDWTFAINSLENAKKILKFEDGPCNNLIEYMKQNESSNWKHYKNI